MLAAIREFFHDRDFLEVETPVRVTTPVLEPHIRAVPAGGGWLRTSPELHMKRLLAEGWPRLVQIGPCFRAGETGPLHHPEFTMLEWYRAGAGLDEIERDLRELLPFVAVRATGRNVIRRGEGETDLTAPWAKLEVAEAFRRWAGWDPLAAWDEDRFDLDLVGKVEPALPRDRPVALTGYPPQRAAFARTAPGPPPRAERFELYLDGVEVANAYDELTDRTEHEQRYAEWAAQRQAAGDEVHPLDDAFLACLGRLPRCAGIALGVDRLAMLLCGAESLDPVLAFRERPPEV